MDEYFSCNDGNKRFGNLRTIEWCVKQTERGLVKGDK